MMTLSEEIFLVLSKYQDLCTLEEVAQAINLMRTTENYRHPSNRLIEQLRSEFNLIRKNPRKYGFCIQYKSTSRREPYVAMPMFVGESPLTLTISQQKSIDKGSRNHFLNMRQREINHLEQIEAMLLTTLSREDRIMWERYKILQQGHIIQIDLLLSKAA